MRTVFPLIATLLTGLITPATAQEDMGPLPEEEAEEVVEPIRRYTVELIVFAYGESVSAGTEIWVPEETPVDRSDTANYFGDFDDELTEIEAPAIGRQYMDLELVLFGDDDFTMNGIYDKLVKLEAYQPILRGGWTQPTYERDVTASIPITTLAKAPPWLSGDLTLYLGRYLHLVVDLTMDSDRTLAPEDDEPGALAFGDARVRDEYGELLPPPVRYRIDEDRIVKNGDIRYFDHPKFGVIAKITRFEEEEEEIIDDTDDLLPGPALSP